MKIIDNVTLTATYSNSGTLAKDYLQRAENHLYINYTKGDETSMELKIEYSNLDDVVGSEVWYQLSILNPSTGNIELVESSFIATGKYRVELPGNNKEDKIKVSVKATGGTPTGTVTVEVL